MLPAIPSAPTPAASSLRAPTSVVRAPSEPWAEAPAVAAAGSGLPVHLTGFVGRTRELEELATLLGHVRLLTLTGAGGSGKTRLAREAAGRAVARHEFTRVAWVDLTACPDGALIGPRIAHGLGVAERPDATPLDAVRDALVDAPALLVLDNCEHLVDDCASVVEALLVACPGLRVLATSREALGVAGETAWLVPALDAAEARQLFVERARAALASFAAGDEQLAAVDEICRRLDGIPLAIELAAARVRALTPEQIAERLDDAFRLLTTGSRTALPRHRTLRSAMEWSHALLAERERVLLRRLAVFAGGFTLEAAEAVCTAGGGGAGGLEPDDILDGMAALVDKSLVVLDVAEGVEPRYRLLEVVRQYARERLHEAGEAEALDAAHAAHFLALVEAINPPIELGQPTMDDMARIGAEQDNLRHASRWLMQAAERDPARHGALALRFGASMFWYWYGGGHWLREGQFAEARQFTREAIRMGAGADPVLRVRALMAAGLSAHPQGDYDSAQRLFAEAVEGARALGHRPLMVFSLSMLGATWLMTGDLERAWTLNEEAYALAAHEPRSMLHSFVEVWRTLTACERGELDVARQAIEHNLSGGPEGQRAVVVGHTSAMLGRVALCGGDLDLAGEHLNVALRCHLEIADRWGLALDLELLSRLCAARRRHADAVRLAGAVDALRERAGMSILGVDRAERQRREARARARLGDEAFARHQAEGRTMDAEALRRVAADASVAPRTAEFRIADLAAPAPLAAAPAPPPAAATSTLRVRALGALEAWVGEVPVAASAWGSARTRELLAYLLVHPEGVSKEQVGLALWPDASAAQLRNNFHVTLHRLRRALGGADWIQLAGERYHIAPALLAEFDATAFEAEVAAARAALARATPGAAALLERALARYRGDFLDGEPVGDWHLAVRDRLQRLHADALLALGAHHEGEGRHARAAEAYRRVLTRDPLHEEAVRALLRCHAELGEKAQGLRLYQRFAETLQQELDATPEAATRALARQLFGA